MSKNYLIRLTLVVMFVINIQYGRAQEEKYIGLFTYNFTKYFDWPEDSKSGDFVIEVLGHKSVFDELVRITSGKKIGNQYLVIKNLNSIDEIAKSNILFVGHWQSRYISEIFNKIGDNPTLIVSEMESMLDKGSCINFIISDGAIKFEINLTNIKKRQLKVDPRIRELAYKVVE
jgi:hypothetical protein